MLQSLIDMMGGKKLVLALFLTANSSLNTFHSHDEFMECKEGWVESETKASVQFMVLRIY